MRRRCNAHGDRCAVGPSHITRDGVEATRGESILSVAVTAVRVADRGGAGRVRLAELEGLRAVAAMSVLVYHLALFTFALRTAGVGWAFRQLDVGVWIFFVVSGYLLYAPFAAAHAGAGGVDVRGFLWRRGLRIYPAYWAALVVVPWLFMPAFRFADWGRATRAALLVHTYVDPRGLGSPGLTQSWTLVVEMTFYVFLPVYASIVAAVLRRRQRRHSVLAIEWIGAAALAAIGIGTSIAVAFADGPLWVHVLPMNLLPFAIGMATAVARTHGIGLFGVGRGLVMFVVAWGGLVLYASLVQPSSDRAWVSARGLVFAVAAAGLVVPFTRGGETGRLARALHSAPMTFLGAISYGIYLWHYGWIGFFYLRGVDQSVSLTFVKLAALAVPFTIATAYLSYRVVERPAIRLSRRLARR